MQDNTDDIIEPYQFSRRDKQLLDSASLLLLKVTLYPLLRPAQLISVAKLRYAIDRLPKVTSNIDVKVSVISPRRNFGEVETYHWFDVAIQDKVITISSAGHFYRPSTGGDTFTTMIWNVFPGEEADYADYLDQLSIVPDARPFGEAIETIDLSIGSYEIQVEDSDNEFLDDEYDDEDNIQEEDTNADDIGDATASWIVSPSDDADRRLAAHINHNEVNECEKDFAYGAEICDFCKCDLVKRGLYVDGKVRSGIEWANMCAPCFEKNGAGIGWGIGQLYALQANGDWRLVAGFQKGDSD